MNEKMNLGELLDKARELGLRFQSQEQDGTNFHFKVSLRRDMVDEEKKRRAEFEVELREAYDNNCFGDIIDVIRDRNKEFILALKQADYINTNGKCGPEIDKNAKEILGDKLC